MDSGDLAEQTPITADLLAILGQMSRLATPAPWVYSDDDEAIHGPTESGAHICAVSQASDFPCLEDDAAIARAERECMHNAEIIPALRNAAPQLIALARLGLTNSGIIDDALATALASTKAQLVAADDEIENLHILLRLTQSDNAKAQALADRVVEQRTAEAIASWIQGDEDRPQMTSVRVASQIRAGEWRKP